MQIMLHNLSDYRHTTPKEANFPITVVVVGEILKWLEPELTQRFHSEKTRSMLIYASEIMTKHNRDEEQCNALVEFITKRQNEIEQREYRDLKPGGFHQTILKCIHACLCPDTTTDCERIMLLNKLVFDLGPKKAPWVLLAIGYKLGLISPY
jgi:hypothetical protein